MDINKLTNKIHELETKLYSLKCLRDKIAPRKPMIDDETKYDTNKKELIHKYTYYCGYCGDKIRKGTYKHKCGQIQNWEDLE